MVDYINAGDRTLPVRISYKVLKKVSTLSGEKEGKFAHLEKLLFFSLEEGHKADEKIFNLTEELLIDLIDEHPEVLGQFSKIVENQLGDLTGKLNGGVDMSSLQGKPTGTDSSKQELPASV